VAAPAAAEVPVLAYLVVGLLAMVAWAVCLGLHGVWIHTFGALFHKLGGIKISAGPIGSAHPLGFLDDAANSVANALLSGAQKSQHTMGYFFHGVAVIQGWVARELVGLATDTLHWMQWMQRVVLPKALRILPTVLFPWTKIVRFIAQEIAKELPRFKRITNVNVKLDRATLKRLVALAVAAAVGTAIPGLHLPRRVKQLEQDWNNIKARLRKLERAAGATGAVALFTAALAKLGLKWLRCKNVTKAGKAVCSSDASWLTSLLGDALVIASVISVVEFAKELQAIEGEAVKILGVGIREFPG
jgi:hypothetical protein